MCTCSVHYQYIMQNLPSNRVSGRHCRLMRGDAAPGLPSQGQGYGKMMARDEVVFVAAVANGIHFNSISPAG